MPVFKSEFFGNYFLVNRNLKDKKSITFTQKIFKQSITNKIAEYKCLLISEVIKFFFITYLYE